MNELTIGRLAKAAKVGVETVRYYQRRGLLREPSRPYGAARRYDRTDVERLRFIRAAQAVGFSLKEVAELLALEGGGDCRAVKRLAREKLEVIHGRISNLQRIEKTLTALARGCETASGRMDCPLIESLHTHTREEPESEVR